MDNKTTLDPEDDAATQIMGGEWRMPTKVEFDELINNTSNGWVTNYNGSGVNGRVFIASNGNSIFIPAAGYRDGGSMSNATYGNVWCSSIHATYSIFAEDLDFYSGDCGVGSYNRCYGLSVRGVRK